MIFCSVLRFCLLQRCTHRKYLNLIVLIGKVCTCFRPNLIIWNKDMPVSPNITVLLESVTWVRKNSYARDWDWTGSSQFLAQKLYHITIKASSIARWFKCGTLTIIQLHKNLCMSTVKPLLTKHPVTPKPIDLNTWSFLAKSTQCYFCSKPVNLDTKHSVRSWGCLL